MDTLLKIKEIKRIPGIHQHNTFAKLIEEIYGDDFIYDNHWKIKHFVENEENELYCQISSSKFKEIIFDKNGKLAKYILDEITRESLEVLNSGRGLKVDYEELERLIDIYQCLFKNETRRGKNSIERECKEVFYMRDFQRFLDPQTKYDCIHGKRKYICKDCEGSQIRVHKKIKYYCKYCEGSQICQHKEVKNACRLCRVEYFVENEK